MDYAKIKRPATLIGIEPLPAELVGLQAESLTDLDWTDPALGLHGHAYWPVVEMHAVLGPGETHGEASVQVISKKKHVERRWPAVAMPAEARQGVIADRLRELLAVIDIERARRIAQGKPHTFPDGQMGVVQLRHERDLMNVNAVATTGTALVALGDSERQVVFRDAGDVSHELTGAQAVAFGLAVMHWVSAHYAAAWAHKDALKALAGSDDLDALLAYDLTQGWPPISTDSP